uniref:Uncharacterized protein n=1 Tax=Arundo donax TaxID=35708 RepID=A0A0A8Z176_ARUDO
MLTELAACNHLTSRIHCTQSCRSWNFWLVATFMNTRILLRKYDDSSLHRNEPPQEHCSDKWAAFTCLQRTQTRSCKWYSLSRCRTTCRSAFSICSRW